MFVMITNIAPSTVNMYAILDRLDHAENEILKISDNLTNLVINNRLLKKSITEMKKENMDLKDYIYELQMQANLQK